MTDWTSISQHIGDATGRHFEPRNVTAIGGGCINDSYRLSDKGRAFFIKLNHHSQRHMFEAEAEGLEAILHSQSLRVPAPVCLGIADGQAYLVLEYLHLGTRGDARQLGRQLAQMHRTTQSRYGWQHDNTLGTTPQPNAPDTDWVAFWQQRRLGFQLQLAAQKGARLGPQAEQLLAQVGDFFTDYQPRPSLLHGDLWSGNHAYDDAGQPVIFDPAVYFGDRECDLAMTELFGGFPADFYAAYNAAWPLDPGYGTRKTLYNLYHVLNHFNLFGGGYLAQAQRMVAQLLSEIR